MNIHLKTILAMVTAFSVAMVPQSHAFAFGEAQVDEEYSVSLADSQTDTSYTKWLSSWNQTNYDSVTNVVLTPGSNLASLNFSWYAKTGTTRRWLSAPNRIFPTPGFFPVLPQLFPAVPVPALIPAHSMYLFRMPLYREKTLLLPGHQ